MIDPTHTAVEAHPIEDSKHREASAHKALECGGACSCCAAPTSMLSDYGHWDDEGTWRGLCWGCFKEQRDGQP